MDYTERLDDDFVENSYITKVAYHYCPGYEEINGKVVLVGTYADSFIHRFNDKQIRNQDKFKEYLENKNIQDCLDNLKIDPVEFWYLLLFVYDYCEDLCFHRTDFGSETVKEEIDRLINALNDNKFRIAKNTNTNYVFFTYDEPVELSFHIGKRKISITDKRSIGLIGLALQEGIKEFHTSTFNSYSSTNAQEEVKSSYTDMAYMFCEMLVFFFDGRVTRAKGAKISNMEKELLSYLLYFTEISNNKKLLEPRLNDYNTLKGFMNPKKKPTFRGMLDYYGFWGSKSR